MLASWLDAFAETADVVAWGIGPVVATVMISIPVNPEAIKKQGGQVRT